MKREKCYIRIKFEYISKCQAYKNLKCCDYCSCFHNYHKAMPQENTHNPWVDKGTHPLSIIHVVLCLLGKTAMSDAHVRDIFPNYLLLS